MTVLEKELAENFSSFRNDWTSQAASNWKTLSSLNVFEESYRRIACIHAIKNDLVLPNFSADSAAFFLEAHNDALVSHVSASSGSWRAALQSLRSCIENAFNAIYYKDHPVELQLWSDGASRMGFTELFNYVERHPKFSKYNNSENGLDTIKKEYATLSRAVHASTANFRMTDKAATILLWDTDTAKANSWAAREIKVIEGITMVLAFLFSEKLTGTQLSALRTMMSFTISTTKRTILKNQLSIII